MSVVLRRSAALVAAACTALCVSIGAASAGPVADDGGSTARPAPALIPTTAFAPGEVDLTTLGVPDSELLNIGLVGATTSSAGDGPNMFIVDDDKLQCPNAAYMTIQAAVLASGPGDQIKVCPGIYNEQVRIMGSSHDGLRLFSEVPLQAMIRMPLVDIQQPRSVVLVDGARDVDVRHFTISGPFAFPDVCVSELNDRHTGVRVRNGSLTLYGNHITEIRNVLPALRGCQDGLAVQIGRRAQGEVGVATIRNNLIDQYQKGGIVVDNAGSYALITQNEIDGDPALSGLNAQNGVQVGRGAGADVNHNEIRDNLFCCNANDDSASGVLVFDTTVHVSVDHNDVLRNGLGIALFDRAIGLEVSHNKVRDSLNSGIEAFSDAVQNLIAYNMATGSHPDCADDTSPDGGTPPSTSNFWIKDMGLTQNKLDLCKNATLYP
jgi:hypothetical protein